MASLVMGLLRLLLVALYLAAAMAALGSIGLAISTFTEHPLGAVAAQLVSSLTAQGDGGLDHSALLKLVAQLSGRQE